MRLLLDTHAFLWWLDGDRRLSRRARSAISDDTNTILVSAATAWEITTKARLGKLPGAVDVAADSLRQVWCRALLVATLTPAAPRPDPAAILAHRSSRSR